MRISVLVVVLLLGLFSSYAAKPEYASPNQSPSSSTPGDRAKQTSAVNWTFEGCFAFQISGPCYDVFRDDSGNYWICSLCGQTHNPGPGKCRQL